MVKPRENHPNLFGQRSHILDLRKIARSQGKSDRAKTVFSERNVPSGTLKEEKQFAAGHIWPGDGGVLRKSSIHFLEQSTQQNAPVICEPMHNPANSGTKHVTNAVLYKKQLSNKRLANYVGHPIHIRHIHHPA